MRFTEASCPYCGEPVIMDKKGRGLCEYCGQWVIYDGRTGMCVLEADHHAGCAYEEGNYHTGA